MLLFLSFFFVICRLDLGRCSAANWCGLRGVPTSFPSSGWRGSYPFLWFFARIQQPRENTSWQSGAQMLPDKETWICKGLAGGAHPLQANHLVWRPASNTFWCSPAGGNRQKFREEGWRLVWPIDSCAYSSVSSLRLDKCCFKLFWSRLSGLRSWVIKSFPSVCRKAVAKTSVAQSLAVYVAQDCTGKN